MSADSGEIVLRRTIMASQEVAFEAWTTPGHVLQWWRPTETARCTLAEFDLRVGGRYRIDMSDPSEGTNCKVEGRFQEVTPPRRLVYTWKASTHEGNVENTLVTVEFHFKSRRETEVLLRHKGLPDAPIRQAHRETWEKMLASFATWHQA